MFFYLQNHRIVMKNVFKIICILLLIAFVVACNQEVGIGGEKITLVMTTELVNDSNVFKFYDSMHSKQGIWPAITKANLASGIEQIRIYRFENRLMMMVELPAGTDMAKMDSLYVNADPKVKEWGKMMDGLQRALPGVDSTKKWVDMKLIHHYRDGSYLK